MDDPPSGFSQIEPATSMPDWYSDLLESISQHVSIGRRRAAAAATQHLVLTSPTGTSDARSWTVRTGRGTAPR